MAEGRTLVHLYCRQLVGDATYADWLVANGMTYKRCRFVEEYTMIRRRYRDIRNAALAYPSWTVTGGSASGAASRSAPVAKFTTSTWCLTTTAKPT